MTKKQETNLTDKALKASDPSASVIGAVVAICGTFGLLEEWGLTADELAIVIGALGSIAAGARAWVEAKKREEKPSLDNLPIDEIEALLEVKRARDARKAKEAEEKEDEEAEEAEEKESEEEPEEPGDSESDEEEDDEEETT